MAKSARSEWIKIYVCPKATDQLFAVSESKISWMAPDFYKVVARSDRTELQSSPIPSESRHSV